MARTNWKKAYAEQQEELTKLREELGFAEDILVAQGIGGAMDLRSIYDMERKHEGTIDQAIEERDEIGEGKLEFWHFVEAVKRVSLIEIEDAVEEMALDLEQEGKDEDAKKLRQHYESFKDVSIDQNYCAWGDVADWGAYDGPDKQKNEELQSVFAEFVSGVYTKDEFLDGLKKALRL